MVVGSWVWKVSHLTKKYYKKVLQNNIHCGNSFQNQPPTPNHQPLFFLFFCCFFVRNFVRNFVHQKRWCVCVIFIFVNFCHRTPCWFISLHLGFGDTFPRVHNTTCREIRVSTYLRFGARHSASPRVVACPRKNVRVKMSA